MKQDMHEICSKRELFRSEPSWQALRFLADDSIAEHNMRRALMRRIVSKSVELQLCDLSGACSTQALLDLGPQESKAA